MFAFGKGHDSLFLGFSFSGILFSGILYWDSLLELGFFTGILLIWVQPKQQIPLWDNDFV